jgi:hypothetical protein
MAFFLRKNRAYVAMILDIRNVNRLYLLFVYNHRLLLRNVCVTDDYQFVPWYCSFASSLVVFCGVFYWPLELHLFFFFCFLGGITLKVVKRWYEHERTWNKNEFHDEPKFMFIFVRSIFVCVHETRWITDLKHKNI